MVGCKYEFWKNISSESNEVVVILFDKLKYWKGMSFLKFKSKIKN